MEPEINFTLGIELLVFRINLFKFDGDFFFGLEVRGLPNLAEGAVA